MGMSDDQISHPLKTVRAQTQALGGGWLRNEKRYLRGRRFLLRTTFPSTYLFLGNLSDVN